MGAEEYTEPQHEPSLEEMFSELEGVIEMMEPAACKASSWAKCSPAKSIPIRIICT